MCIDILSPYVDCSGFDLPRLSLSVEECLQGELPCVIIQQIKIELKKLKLLTLLLNCGITSGRSDITDSDITDSNIEKYR